MTPVGRRLLAAVCVVQGLLVLSRVLVRGAPQSHDDAEPRQDSAAARTASPTAVPTAPPTKAPPPLTTPAGVQLVRLSSGGHMPVVGFGTAALGEFTKEATLAALAAGYTHIDSAQAREWYREDLVGQALQESGALSRRESLFITSKIHPRNLGYDRTRSAVPNSLRDLHVDYLDLMLLHYPHCYGMCGGQEEGDWRQSWRALEEFVDEGKVRAIGVSNMHVHELRELYSAARIKPSVVQVHSDPLSFNGQVQDFCRDHDIQFEAYSSLGTQHAMRTGRNPVLTNPAVVAIANAHSTSPGVVVLRWALSHGQVVIPRSRRRDHMEANLKAGALELTPDEIARIDSLR